MGHPGRTGEAGNDQQRVSTSVGQFVWYICVCHDSDIIIGILWESAVYKSILSENISLLRAGMCVCVCVHVHASCCHICFVLQLR